MFVFVPCFGIPQISKLVFQKVYDVLLRVNYNI